MIKGKESVRRSKKVIFLSHCILFQSIRAHGVSIKFSAVVRPIVELLMENNINLIQMPCPEIPYDGVIRKAVRKDVYDNPKFRKICSRYARQVVNLMRDLSDAGFKIVGILGVENSPTCGVRFVFRERKGRVNEPGIFIEELQRLLLAENFKHIPFLGIKTYNIEKSLLELRDIILKQTSLMNYSTS